ncbi:MAG: hypothetical protein JXB85_03335 [Anaerolineales bacterium]|nr:hypothetical protein [Anaerolineales bacterium]
MWLIAEYEAVTLFSLKLSTATSSGGKTLLVPTPYALKMALLDSACRTLGVKQAESLWEQIRDLHVAIRPASKVVVTNLFQRILRPYKNPPKEGTPDSLGPFQRTIGYREYAQLIGPMSVGLELSETQKETFVNLLLNINYFGKRGGFMQLVKTPHVIEELPPQFVDATNQQISFSIFGTLQVLDDCAPSLSFEKANIYSAVKLKDGDRIRRNVILPYRKTRSSKSFSLYEYVTD